MNYCKIDDNIPHMNRLIKWLVDEVTSAGGDGDAIWYSKYYKLSDIQSHIENNRDEIGIPKWWTISYSDDQSCLNIWDDQEGLIITNSKDVFDNRPSWQQCSIVW